MKKILTILSLGLVLLMSVGVPGAGAAVTQTKYRLVYNTTTCRYDVFLIITAGSASASNERKTYTAQVSIVVPSGTAVGSTYANEPKQSFNGGTTRGTALGWNIQNFQSGSAAFGLNGSDVYSLVAPTSNAFYGTLNTNDTLLLFSIDIPTTSCGSGVRLWNNNYIQAGPGAPYTPAGGDPTSAQFNNKDFNNGHDFYNATTAVQTQTYIGNGSGTTTLPKPTITPFTLSVSGGNIVTSSVIATGSTCATLSSYTFTGPNAYSNTVTVSGTSATATLSRPLNAANLGTYTLTVTNINGCTASASNSIALPIKLLSFKGVANKCAAQLSWEVVHGEKDFQGFDLQYSTDGAHFGTISHVERSQYNDAYSSSYIQASGKGYYRLKVTDLAGKESYSETVIVTTDCDNPEITIAPNPTQALSTVSGIASGDQVKVTDMLGNVIANYVSGGSRATIDLGIFPSGIYSVMISRGTDILKTAKITKL